MATLQQHKEAMVDLLANGSAIPASASRLAHALHDVLALLEERRSEPHRAPVDCRVSEFVDGEIRPMFVGGITATAAFSDAVLAADVDVCSAQGHQWASLRNAHTVACMRCGIDKKNVAINTLASVIAERDSLRAELANVTSQRNTYKARCESLEAEIEQRCAQYEEVVAENRELKGYLNRGIDGVEAWQLKA